MLLEWDFQHGNSFGMLPADDYSQPFHTSGTPTVRNTLPNEAKIPSLLGWNKPLWAQAHHRYQTASSMVKYSINAAVKRLAEFGTPMTTKAMIEAMATRGYWISPARATLHATLYSAILRQLQKKGADARFVKADRGQFTLNPATKVS